MIIISHQLCSQLDMARSILPVFFVGVGAVVLVLLYYNATTQQLHAKRTSEKAQGGEIPPLSNLCLLSPTLLLDRRAKSTLVAISVEA